MSLSNVGRLVVLGCAILLGACVASGPATSDVTRAPAAMTGASLSAMHAAIPAPKAPEELPAQF